MRWHAVWVVAALAAPAGANTLDASFTPDFARLTMEVDVDLVDWDAETVRYEADRNAINGDQDGHASQQELDTVGPFAGTQFAATFRATFDLSLDGAEPVDVLAERVRFSGPGPVNGDPLPTTATIRIFFTPAEQREHTLEWRGVDHGFGTVTVSIREPEGTRIVDGPGAVADGVLTFQAEPSQDITIVFEKAARDSPWPLGLSVAALALLAWRGKRSRPA